MGTQGGCKVWFRQRTNFEKTLLSLSTLLTVTLILLLLIGISIHGPKSDDHEDKELECWSTECISTAGRVLSTLNDTVNPCHDFYTYACGGYPKTYSVSQKAKDSVYLALKDMLESSSKSSVDNFDSAKSLYKSCMEFEGLHKFSKETAEILLQLMNRFGVGGWPVVSAAYEQSPLTIPDRLTNLALLGIPVAFRIEVVPDNRTAGAHLLKISPGGPVESGRSAVDIRSDHNLRTSMLFSLLLLGTPTYLRATSAVDDILAVDAYYATVQQDTESNCDTLDILSPEESLYKLNSFMPEMNWTNLIERIKQEAGLKRPLKVELLCKSKIRDYLVHLNDLTSRTAYDYLGWRFFESFSKHIGPIFKHPPPGLDGSFTRRWKQCVLLLEKYAPHLLSQALIHQNYIQKAEEKVLKMTQAVSTSLEQLVSKNSWLKEHQTSLILGQVRSMKIKTPYLNNDANPEHLPKVQSDNYTSVVITLRKQWIIAKLKKLDYPTKEMMDFGELFLTSDGASSAIYFDKIQQPYFINQGSEWLSYGGLGSWLSTMLTKDLLHSKLSDSTMLWDIWYKEKKNDFCQFQNLPQKLDGHFEEERLKNLFADASGLEIAFGAARNSGETKILPGMSSFTKEQLFFIGYAQSQCNENERDNMSIKDRMNTLTSISKPFDDAFRCSSKKTTCETWS